MEEIYKTIEGHPNYEVSNLGNIRNRITKKYRTPCLNKQNYYQLIIDGKSYKVHRLVAKAFIANPNNYKEVNHKDENHKNNCVDNLEWCDRKYNCNYGTRNNRSSIKQSEAQVFQYDENGNIIRKYNSLSQVYRSGYYNVSSALRCNRFNRYFYNYYWFYEHEHFDKNRKRERKVYIILKKGIEIYRGKVSECAAYLCTTRDTIRRYENKNRLIQHTYKILSI